jgi:hypothetical protein
MNQLTEEARIAEIWERRLEEQEERNLSRLYEWAAKKFNRDGHWPALTPHRFQNQHHGNTGIIKFPRKKRQYIGAMPDGGPEAA